MGVCTHIAPDNSDVALCQLVKDIFVHEINVLEAVDDALKSKQIKNELMDRKNMQ